MSARLSLLRPSQKTIDDFLAAQVNSTLTYSDVGLTLNAGVPDGWFRSHRREKLSDHPSDFDRAVAELRKWRMFDLGWVQQVRPDVVPEVGAVVGVLIKAGGLWCLNACRVVLTINERGPIHRVGFSYGTLPGHVERGEERFLIEQDLAGAVWYDLFAFSKPAHWLAKLGHPFARRQQRRFAVDSAARMRLVFQH